MTTIPFGIYWVDSAAEPTLAQASMAKQDNAFACGFYIGGHLVDPYHVWSRSGVDILRQMQIIPVPIYVPDPGLPQDPVSAAQDAYNQAVQYGCKPTVSVLYNGNHIAATGSVWIPTASGVPPQTIGDSSSIQWGQGDYGGWGVDKSSGHPTFPFEQSIVVDFEYNTQAGTAGSAWYAAFQLEITKLGNSNQGDEVTSEDITNVVNGVMLAIREEFAGPGNELHDRVVQIVRGVFDERFDCGDPGIPKTAVDAACAALDKRFVTGTNVMDNIVTDVAAAVKG